jgi:hypothetical protein
VNRPEMKADKQFQDSTITEVRSRKDGYEITMETGWTLGAPLGPIMPEVGQAIRLYGRGTGYAIRGIVIAGQVFRYQTETEAREEHARTVAQQKLDSWEAYKAGTAEREAAIALLPDVFQRRLRRFMENAPETAWDHQGYELATCQAALAIAAACDIRMGVHEFAALTCEQQIEEAPELDTLGLSGNQFGMACRLAHWYLTERENVWKEHAAISILTGCAEAGCPPVTEPPATAEVQP